MMDCLFLPGNTARPEQKARQHFQKHFREWKFLYFDSNFTEVGSEVSNWEWVSICSGNGLAPDKRQVTWTSAYQMADTISHH